MINRRRFLQSSLAVALLPTLARYAPAAGLKVRQDWNTFCQGPMLPVLLDAIGTMRQNPDSTSPASWVYWANTHHSYCPHGKPYFLAWHRGFLYRFEAWLRKVSGVSTLTLPYWDYYSYAAVPQEFLDPSSSLYKNGRTGSDVTGALSMDAFADTVTLFPNGTTDAFEPTLETRPHNPVHNLIGGAMSNIAKSPLDPLFWVHHANIDRLWVGWVAAGNGRTMPAADDPYWYGQFQYGAGLRTMPRKWTIDTTSVLGYQYDNASLPAGLPPAPATTSFAAAATKAPRVSESATLGQAQPLVLDERSHDVRVSLGSTAQAQVRSLMLAPAGAAAGSGALRVVLDGVRLTGRGERGGYFYNVYLTPSHGAPGGAGSRLIGTLGPFEISVARMQQSMASGAGHMGGHAGSTRMVFPVTAALRAIWPADLGQLTVSFVRVGSHGAPTGPAIAVDRFVLETAANP